ncbi:unnamed protein product [Nippostrongylus brasiliensis]|uniref:Probable splicing factor, arginine/serine-rich 7 (inferred by orthology to a C. elegans protein) n=1 Tax=Nippostrongylus brasiliensis TaxID=27835 RepID=A0A0N4Y0C8_NIPBR|nr:unnamed protein product [Nippostrongylus brasiliensis]
MGADSKREKIKILQVSNISVSATKDQIFTMFQYIGRIEELKVYPSDMNITSSTTSKCAFIKYDDDRAVEVGQHLTNTVLIDRAVVCAPYLQGVIPDEATFTNSGGPVMAGQRQLPPHVTNKVQQLDDGSSVLLTVDPQMDALGLPAYPALPGNTDLAKVEEIRRTIYVGNLPKGVDGQVVLDFFNSYVGEVMYLRMALGPETLPCDYAYIEFTNQTSVPIALQNNGVDFQGRPLRIQHSRVAIIKPQAKSADQALEEVEEAIRMGKSESSAGSLAEDRDRVHRYVDVAHHHLHLVERADLHDVAAVALVQSLKSDDEADRSLGIANEAARENENEVGAGKGERVAAGVFRKSRDKKKEKEKKEKERKRSRSRDRKKERDSKRDRSSDRKKERDRDRKDKEKAKVEELDEETLRERLLEKAAVRSGKDGSESDRDSEVEKSGDKTPSRIRNERKRRLSESD